MNYLPEQARYHAHRLVSSANTEEASTRSPTFARIEVKLRELANRRCRFGYRRLHILLRREGVMINRKQT